MTTYDRFETQGTLAGLDFHVDKPTDWIEVPIPAEEHDFTQLLTFAPLAVLMTPYAPVVFSVAARPTYAEGTIAQWLQFVARERGLDPGTLEHEAAGQHAGVGCWGAQIENGMTMRARILVFEDGERLVNISCMAPDPLWQTFAPVFHRMLASFALQAVRGATVALAPADAPLAPNTMAEAAAAAAPRTVAAATPPAEPARGPLPMPGEERDADADADAEPETDDTQAAAVALAHDMATFDAEHPLNVKLRDRGAGLVPNVLDYHEQEYWATLAPAALRATLRVPFGWHVIDDGRRTLVLDAGGHTQVNLQLTARNGQDDDAILATKAAELQREWPTMRWLRTATMGLQCLLVRDATIDGKPIEQAYLLRAAPDDRVLQVRVTSTPERFHAAADLAGVLLRNLQFPGEEPAEVTSPEESPASPE